MPHIADKIKKKSYHTSYYKNQGSATERLLLFPLQKLICYVLNIVMENPLSYSPVKCVPLSP